MTLIAAVKLLGASFYSTHHASAHDAIAGHEREATAPAYKLLVARARRFTSLATQLHLEVCGALPLTGAEPPSTVFATCHGEIQTAENLIGDFRDNGVVSSARFALSVHNTPSGLYSVATASHAPSTTVTGANAIPMGWLEAALTALDAGRTVLLSIADEPVPAVFEGPTERAGVAAAFLLAPLAAAGRRAELVSIDDAGDAPLPSLGVLARAVDAWTREAPATIVLGDLHAGARLELRLS